MLVVSSAVDHARVVGVSEACRVVGIHRSTYYRWKAMVERSGLQMLRPRERRAPRMPNQTSPVIEARILAFAIAHPGLGPRRISATLAQERWGALVISHTGVWRILRRHGLSRRMSRLSLVAGYAAPPGPGPREPETERHLDVSRPGELVGLDCFHVGRLSGSSGRVWQYMAIDLASSVVWAELHTTPLNPSARNASRLARREAADLARQGWRLERVQRTIFEECWRPSFGTTTRSAPTRDAIRRGGCPGRRSSER
jgi:transposase